MMDRRDQEVDGVLRSLGGAEAPAGMEARILQRLAVAPVPRAAWFGDWRVTAAAALAAAVVVTGVVMLPSRVVPAGQAPIIKTRHVEAQPEALPKPETSAAVTMPKLVSVQRSAVPPPPTLKKEPASFPAPPMPLTDQERALLAIARSRDLPKFAAYNPENRDELLAQGRAEFNEFFPQPTPQEIYFEAHRENP